MKAVFVINPISGGGRGLRSWPTADAFLRGHEGLPFDYSYAFTNRRNDAYRITRQAVQGGVDLVVAVGGDGTINEVVNGIMAEAAGSSVQLGVVQAGTGSDFGRTVGVPSDVRESLARLVDGRVQTIDAGRASYERRGRAAGTGTRYFVNVAGVGFDAEVANRADRSRQGIGKVVGGNLPYLSALFTTLLRYHNQYVQLEVDGEPMAVRDKVYSVVVANCQYFGGGMRVAPDADMADGLFDVVIMGNFSKLETIRNVPRLYDGSHIYLDKVQTLRCQSLRVMPRNPRARLFVQTEGEMIGLAPASFEMVSGALRLRV